MTIKLHPNVAALVLDMVRQCKSRKPTTAERLVAGPPITRHLVVNEILWLALRKGDISKHYTQ